MGRKKKEDKLVEEQKEYDYLDYKKAKKNFERERKRAEKQMARAERRAARFEEDETKMRAFYSVFGFAGWTWVVIFAISLAFWIIKNL